MKIIIVLYVLYLSSNSCAQRCGLAGNSTRIVGGQVAPAGQWPWMALLRATFEQEDGTHTYICGGTIISEQWILTAAHCLRKTVMDRLIRVQVTLGAQYLNQNDGTTINIYAAEAIVHQNYSSDTNINDIGLLRLTQSLDLSGNNTRIGAICLPINRQTNDNNQCYGMGWGTTMENGTVSNQLRQVRLPILNNTVCANAYGQLFFPNRQICAGYRQGGKDTCQGDSGGPLVCPFGNSNRWLQSGIVSWGYGCARPGIPGLYTRVAYYTNWIQVNTGLSFP